jgi:hypothetical protein
MASIFEREPIFSHERPWVLTAPCNHARQYKEMLHTTELLPPGKTPPPSKKLAVQWYYMTYHKVDWHEYVKSGKKLSDTTIKTLTAYPSRFLPNAKMMARSNVLRSSGSRTAPSRCSQTTFARSARCITRIMLIASTSASAGDMTQTDRIAEAVTIGVGTPMVDWDATGTTNTTSNQNVVTAMVEAIVRRDATTANAGQRWRKGHGRKATTKRANVMTAIDATCTINLRKSMRTILMLNSD